MDISVTLPSQLDDYTSGQRQFVLNLSGQTASLADVVNRLDALFPGLGFRVVDEHRRIRRHIAMFVGETLVHDLGTPLNHGDRVQIVGALSGG